jgi:hypothetical protein
VTVTDAQASRGKQIHGDIRRMAFASPGNLSDNNR